MSLQCNNCVIHRLPERFRGELLIIGRYTNPASFFLLCRCICDDRLSLLLLQAGGVMARDRHHHQQQLQQHQHHRPVLSTNCSNSNADHSTVTSTADREESPQPSIKTREQASAEKAVNWHGIDF